MAIAWSLSRSVTPGALVWTGLTLWFGLIHRSGLLRQCGANCVFPTCHFNNSRLAQDDSSHFSSAS